VDGEGGGKRPGVAEANRCTGGGGLYNHPPVFGDFTLILVGQSIRTEPEDARRKCLPSVPLISRTHIARHRRSGGTPMLSFLCCPCLSCGAHQKHT